jgi:hypothetical protein
LAGSTELPLLTMNVWPKAEERDVRMQSGLPKDIHDTARGSVIFNFRPSPP